MPAGISSKEVGEGIWCVVNQTFAANTYVCRSDVTGECFIIDPGLDAPLIDECLGKLSLKPRHIFCTHGHFDHMGSASFFQKKYDAKVYLHAADIKTMQAANFLLMAFKINSRVEMPRLEIISEAEFCTTVGNQVIKYDLIPGHTKGSCIIRCGSAVFSGDSLYSRGIGFSRLPGENPGQLRDSLLRLWDRIPSESTIYPGHGSCVTFGWIRQHNHALLEFLNIEHKQQKGN